MKTKKIFAAALAGLCAVSAMGVSAFAADDTTKIEAAGEKAYKITAGFQAPTMDVTVPTEIKGVINPYKIAIKLDGKDTEAEGIASPRYAITNNSEEVGVKVNATYSADGLDGIVASEDDATDPAKNTKGQKLAYVTLNAALGTDAAAETTKVMSATEATANEILKLDVKDGADGDSGEIWIGGAVIETPAEKWTTKDKLTINVVLDLVPFNTGATTTPGGGGFTADVAAGDITLASPATLGALVANNVYEVTYDGGVGGNVTPAFAGYSVTNATCATAGCTVRASDARFSCTADGTYDIVITLENDSDSSDTPTITFRVTATDC